jgi:hypothetical protein
MNWILVGVGDFINILALIAGAVVWGQASRPVRLLVLLLALNFLVDMAGILMGKLYGHNLILMNSYTLIQYPIIAVILSHWLDGRAKSIVLLSIPVFPAACLVMHLVGFENLFGSGKYFHTLEALLAGLIVMRVIYSLMLRSAGSPIQLQEAFWITIGTFFLVSIGVAVYAAIPEQITYELWYIHTLCVIIAYLLYIRGFWCLRQERNRTAKMIHPL